MYEERWRISWIFVGSILKKLVCLFYVFCSIFISFFYRPYRGSIWRSKTIQEQYKGRLKKRLFETAYGTARATSDRCWLKDELTYLRITYLTRKRILSCLLFLLCSSCKLNSKTLTFPAYIVGSLQLYRQLKRRSRVSKYFTLQMSVAE